LLANLLEVPMTNQLPHPLPEGVTISGPVGPEGARILTTDAMRFLADLVRRFDWRREELLERRRELQKRWDQGWRPGFVAETAFLREADWKVAPLPPDRSTGGSRSPDPWTAR